MPSPVIEKVAVPESFGQAGARPSDTASPHSLLATRHVRL
jgi:hypothetical protein